MDPKLYKAAMEGDIEEIRRRNACQFHVQLTPNKNTLLHVAAQFGQIECVNEILLKCGGSLLCSVNIKGDTSLHISVREGFTDIVKALVEFAKNLDAELESGTKTTEEMPRMRNEEGDTALHDAVRNVQNDNLDVVEFLIREDPGFEHPPNEAEETPLFLAVNSGSTRMVEIILNNCTSPIYSGPNGRRALYVPTIDLLSRECIKILHTLKPSLIKETDVYGWTPLHYAAKNGDTNWVKELLNLDKYVAYCVSDDDDKMTVLHIAANQSHVNVLKELLFFCPDCWEVTNNKGQNILHIAIEHEEEEIIKFILTKSIFSILVNQKDIDGNTPSHLCAAKFHSKRFSGDFLQILLFFLEAFNQDVGMNSSLMDDVLRHNRTNTCVINKENLTPLEVACGKVVTTSRDINPKKLMRAVTQIYTHKPKSISTRAIQSCFLCQKIHVYIRTNL